MNKRITTIFLCLVMVVAMLVSAVPVFAETSAHPPVTFTIKPDKTTAKPGDTITYQVFVGPVENLRTAQFELVIPDGLEYTGGSSPEGLTAKMNAFSAAYTSDSKIFVLTGTGRVYQHRGYAAGNHYMQGEGGRSRREEACCYGY